MVDNDDPVKKGAQLAEYFRTVMGNTRQGFPERRGLKFIEDSSLKTNKRLEAVKLTPQEEGTGQVLEEFISKMRELSGVEGIGFLVSPRRSELSLVVFNRWDRETDEGFNAYDLSGDYKAQLWEALGRMRIGVRPVDFDIRRDEGLDDARIRFNREWWHRPGVQPVGLVRFPLSQT